MHQYLILSEMKRFITASCILFFAAARFVVRFVSAVEAKEDVLMKLLDLPAPPPPNPLAKYIRAYPGAEFNKRTPPPKDDAPIEELLDYWKHESESFAKLRYSPALPNRHESG